MPGSYRIRCQCCLGVAGYDIQWTKMLLTFWLCDGCWDYLSKDIGCKDCYEELGNTEETKKFRQAVKDMPSSREIRLANTIKYGPLQELNKHESVWVEPIMERIHGS